MKILSNKLFKILFFISLLSGIFLFRVSDSKAVGDAYFPNDTTLQITVGSTVTNYTINGGSNADSLVVNASSFVITISAGQRFVVSSSGNHTFPNDGGYSTICPSSDSSSLDVTVVSTQKVVTVTPDGTSCRTTNSGGGGGGGGASGSSASGGGASAPTVSTTQSPSPSPALSTTPSPAPTVSVSSPAPTSPTVPNKLTRDLYFGMSGDDVKALQDYLRVSGYYTNPNSTGFFDTPTKKAVIAWQKKNKLLSNGYFGSYSRAKYNQTSLSPEVVQKKTPDALELKSGIKLLNMRASPSVKANVVSKLKSGQSVHFTDIQNGWYKVQNIDGSLGWVLGRYVIVK